MTEAYDPIPDLAALLTVSTRREPKTRPVTEQDALERLLSNIGILLLDYPAAAEIEAALRKLLGEREVDELRRRLAAAESRLAQETGKVMW